MGERHLEQDHQSVDAAANDKNIIVLFFSFFNFHKNVPLNAMDKRQFYFLNAF